MKSETEKPSIFKKELLFSIFTASAVVFLLSQGPTPISNPVNGPLPTPVPTETRK